ncbi:Outer membrane protein OmpA [Pseudomonas cuatrocienegasensis]|uniref:Outer membrane protein OmpA n=1 Tax=Pseudomonas cuatrocienegasensis TaxID=543360 RepID=A0ABY1B4C3_9PSED|nr:MULTISPECIES: OmpA family protein [Pseudomonas]OEC37214.1 flagellar motor protein MotB [Pseudomonas sp. 21C1]SEP89243.1 Outer membrane protein OmpA [Pseudomonas cuatrocienegasensis]
MFDNKIAALSLCVLLTGCSLFDKQEPKKAAVPMPPPEVTQAWLDEYEPLVREAIKGSTFEMERRENLLVVTAPVDASFNPDRPGMLLPATLGPITRIAKLMEKDNKVALLVLGHADSSGSLERNRELSHERARAFTAIFRLSGLKQDRLMVKGMGPDMPRAANDSVTGRALNRRVEMLMTAQPTMKALVAKYSTPEPAAVAVAAAEPAKDEGTKAKAAAGAKVVAVDQAK